MRKFSKRMASVILLLMVLVMGIPSDTVAAAPKRLATPRIVAVRNETMKPNFKKTPYKVEWGKAKGAAKYQVYRASSVRANVLEARAKYKLVATVKTNSFVDKKANYFDSYYYKVKAISGKVSSAFSKPANTRNIPAAPTLTSSSTSLANRKAANLSWQGFKGASGYQTMVSFKQYSGYKASNVGKKTKASVPFLSDKPGTDHYFAVRAYAKKGGISYYSAAEISISIKPLNPPHVMDILKVNKEFAKLLNAERARVGSSPVRYEPLNQAYASLRAKELQIKWSHGRPCGCSCLSDICPHINIHPVRQIRGENIYYRVGNPINSINSEAKIAQIMFECWEKSPPHYAFMTSTGEWRGDDPNGGYFSVGVSEPFFAVFHMGANPN